MLALLVAVAAPAAAGALAGPRATQARPPRLRVPERRSISIRSVTAVADPSLGLIVTATFHGNVERYLGQGNLTRGVLALVLRPSSGGAPALGVFDLGGGFAPMRAPILGRTGGHVIVSTRTVDVFGAERVQAPAWANVTRYGHQVMFYVRGQGLDRIGRLELEVFANGPRTATLHAIQNVRPTTSASLAVHPAKLSCSQLPAVRGAISRIVSASLAPELRSQQQAHGQLGATVHNYAIIAGRTRMARSALVGAVARTANRIGRLKIEMATLQALTRRFDVSIKACSPPPSSPPPPASSPPPPPAPAPGNTAPPTITGTTQQGQTLTTSTGSWTNNPTSYAYQWQHCSGSTCSDITGASAPTYTLQSTDLGDTIDVIVTATNAGGSTPATSAKTAAVTAPPRPVQVVQTDPGASQLMTPQSGVTLSSTPPQGVSVINVDDQTRYQQFSGIGGAMTDSSAWLIYNKMSSSQRAALMQELFGAPGSGSGLAAPPIHLNFLRAGVAATGAMTVTPAYSYDDNPPGGSDPNLSSFSIAHDTPYIIPTLRQALQINPGLQILGTPWSSPGWMKSNGTLDNTNNTGTLLTSDYDVYARYLVKFIQAYQSQGIPIAGITPANEPTASTPYPGLNLPESGEAQFIAQNLAPDLKAAGLGTKIYGNDLSWDQFSNYASPLATDPNAGPDLAGIAWHCYFGSPIVMTQLHQQAPNDDQIADECSPEIRGFGTPEFLISNLRNWASVASIWSIALDPNGNPIQTPNHCGNCRGAVSIDQTTGDVTFRPEYYQLGQVSAFVSPGATRIDSPNFVTYGTNSSNIETVSSGLDDVAFLNPDGSKVLIAYNNSTASISFGVGSNGSYFTYTIPAQAMTTFVWH